MCNPMIAAAIIAAASAKMQMDAQAEAADRQQKAINDSLELQDNSDRAAEQKGLENAQEYDPVARTQQFEEAKQAAGESLAQQLTQAREEVSSPDQAAGRMSQAFLTGQSKSAADQLEKSVDMARLMGKVRGGSDMLTNEGYRNADYASQLSQIGGNASRALGASQVGIGAAGIPNQGKLGAAGLMRGLGTQSNMSKAFDMMDSSSAASSASSSPFMGAST